MKKLLALLLVATLLCSMFASCGSKKSEDGAATTAPPSTVTYDLDGAAAYVESLYKEDLVVTAVDYKVVSQVMIGGVTYQIDWSVDTDKVTVGTPANGEVVVDVNEKSPEEVSYKLTATIKAGDGSTKTVTFKLSVPKYEVNSHAEYMAAKKDDQLTIEGIVVAINSKEAGNKYNHLFLADTTVTGGYYCYSVKEDPAKLGIKVGMTVKVTGAMSPYSGMQEIKDGQVAIVDSSIKEVKVLDITEQFAAGADLGAYVGLPVTIKGVTIGTQELDKDTSQYLNFKLNDKTAYVRTYVTDFPTSMKAEDKAGIDKDHADHFGYKADATGILVLFNSAPYLIPMSATPFTNYVEVKVTAADKVAAELEGATLDASLSSDKVIELPATGKYYNDVTLSWTTDDTTGAATIKDGKLTIVVPDKEITVNVTVTATCGDATNSKKLTIKLSKVITPIKDLVEIGSAKEHNKYTEEKYIAGGIIVEIQNTTYGNMVIKDESGASILVYGTYINGKKYGDAEGTKPVVGDYVVVIGVVGKYNTTVQIKNADITSFTAASTLKDAAAAGAAMEHNKYTEDKYLVTGEITKIDNDKYGNLYIKDKEGNTLYIYGVYTQNGTRFDGMATKPAVGDTITVLSVAGKYNDTVQLKNATLVDMTSGKTEEPAAPVEMTIPEALKAADDTLVIVKGTVKSIDIPWDDGFKNLSVTIEDAEGNTLYIFRLATNVNVGDKITVTGKMATYKEARQIAQGATATIDEAAPTVPTTPDVWDGTEDTSWFNKDDIKSEYTFTTAEQFAGFFRVRQSNYSAGLTFEGVTFKLARDLILNEATIEEMKANAGKQLTATHSSKALFKGVFDGQGHTISGAYIDCTTSGYRSIFGGLGDNGVIKNLKITNVYLNGTENNKYSGAVLVARAKGVDMLVSNITVENVLMEESTGQFSGVSLLVATVDTGSALTIENCTTAGTINFLTMGINGKGFGGIVGSVESGAEETTAEDGTVTPGSITKLTLKNCSSSAIISGTDNVGGLVGAMGDRCEIKLDSKCAFTGTLTVGEMTETKKDPETGEETTTTRPGNQGEYVGNAPEIVPEKPIIVPELTADDFSSLKYPEFDNAIVIEGASCETGSKIVELKATQFHLYNIDGNAGAAAHGVTKLDQSGVFHYYIDMGNVNKTIASNDGDDKKIAAVEDCYIRWTFNVTEAGTYTFGSYMRLKDEKDRCCQIQIDDKTPFIMHYTLTADDLTGIKDDTHGTYLLWDGVEVELEAGEHTITYSFPTERTAASSWHWRTIYVMKKAA